MTDKMKKLIAYILLALIIFFTVIGLLGVWDVIDLEHITKKLVSSALLIFGAAVVALFVFSAFLKEKNNQ